MKERNLLERGVQVKLLNIEAGKEKSAIPPTVNLHKYSTRKPLITSRMVVAASILGENDLEKNEDFNLLLGIDPSLKDRAYKNVPKKLVDLIYKKYTQKPTILDPFAGTGTIPFEALRLGLNVEAIDYNPVAYMIMKGTLEYPLKFKKTIYKDVEKYSNDIYQKMKQELSTFYPSHNGVKPRTYIHCWTVKCPTCGIDTPLVNNWVLDSKEKIGIQYEKKDDKLIYRIVKNQPIPEGNVSRGKGTCLYCSAELSKDFISKYIKEHQREQLLAVYLDNREFVLPNEDDIIALEKAENYLRSIRKDLSNIIPTEKMPNDRRHFPLRYLTYFFELFNRRQLLVLSIFAREIHDLISVIAQDDEEYAIAIGTYLYMILSRLLMKNNRCVIWNNSRRTIGHILATRGIAMMWNHPEVNPFIKTSGSFLNGRSDVLKGLKFALQALNNTTFEMDRDPEIEIKNLSLTSWGTNKKYQFIITDPPYYDDVPYPELFQYFQIWISRIFKNLLEIPAIPSSSEELSVGNDRDDTTFEQRMLLAFKKLNSLLDDEGNLIMFYAHKSIYGWKFVLEGLRKAGFIVTSTITLMTDREASVIAKDKSSVFHSLVITARKRLEDKTANLLDIEDEIREKIEERYPELVDIYGNDRVNLMVAASGIVIETITSYSEITSFTTNTADYAIEMGQKYLIETFARNTLHVDNVDVKTMLYTWFRHSPVDEIPYTDFNQTLKAFGAAEETLDDIVKTTKGKVTLVDYMNRGVLEVDGMEPLLATTIIDAAHLALRAYTRGGITQAKQGIENSPFGANPIINTIEALSRISATKTNYQEGKTCLQFIRDWNDLHGKPQPTQLRDHFKSDEKEQTKLK